MMSALDKLCANYSVQKNIKIVCLKTLQYDPFCLKELTENYCIDGTFTMPLLPPPTPPQVGWKLLEPRNSLAFCIGGTATQSQQGSDACVRNVSSECV